MPYFNLLIFRLFIWLQAYFVAKATSIIKGFVLKNTSINSIGNSRVDAQRSTIFATRNKLLLGMS